MSTPIETILDKLEYIPTNASPNKEGLPYVTHEGTLQLGEISIRVCVLNTGQRIIPSDELKRVFGSSFAQIVDKQSILKLKR